MEYLDLIFANFIPKFLLVASFLYTFYIGFNFYMALSNKKNIFDLISMDELRYVFLTITYIITYFIV